jgi:hypothetical protein
MHGALGMQMTRAGWSVLPAVCARGTPLAFWQGTGVGLLRKIFFSKNFEALHRNSAERYGDSADEIFAGVEACNAPMGVSSGIPRLMQLLRRRGTKKSGDSVSCWLR